MAGSSSAPLNRRASAALLNGASGAFIPTAPAGGRCSRAFLPGGGAPNAFHFQSQVSDTSIVAEEYYNQNNSGFGTYYKFPLYGEDAAGYAMGPGYANDPRNPLLRIGREENGRGKFTRLAYSPPGIQSLTQFSTPNDNPADNAICKDKDSPGVGKFTHPSGAPDNNLLTIYSPGPTNHNGKHNPQLNGGIYLIKGGKPIDEPAQMRLIKTDPQYNDQWPRAVVPYKRIYGMDEPKNLAPLANDGKLSPALPEGTPFGLVGTSSLYKRESFPRGGVPKGSVTSTWVGDRNDYSVRSGYHGLDVFNSPDESALNWKNQGADAGLYDNDEIHAIRILVMEPSTDRRSGPKAGKLFYNQANERLRILGEIPVRHFEADKEPLDPDGNPDTSFLAKIPADTAFTFQTLDKDGMVLNMAQTWHQVRPGEVRNNCGGCHAHSQEPTPFEKTAAASKDYKIFDLTKTSPLLASKDGDESHRKWSAKDDAGLRYAPLVKNVEYFRDIRPILNRSCAACHTQKWEDQMGMLVLDDDTTVQIENTGKVPATYARLAADHSGKSKWGYKPAMHEPRWAFPNASRYAAHVPVPAQHAGLENSRPPHRRLHQRRPPYRNHSRRSQHPCLARPTHPPTSENRDRADIDYTGAIMPPPEAVAGTYLSPDGSKIKVEPLSDEDRRNIIRWIDLGCPIDFDYDATNPSAKSYGWMCNENRPVLTVTYPKPGPNPPLTRILLGMYDYTSGVDEKSLSVKADFPVAGKSAGEELAPLFKQSGDGIWELSLLKAVDQLQGGTLKVSVKDHAGNVTRIERWFCVQPK